MKPSIILVGVGLAGAIAAPAAAQQAHQGTSSPPASTCTEAPAQCQHEAAVEAQRKKAEEAQKRHKSLEPAVVPVLSRGAQDVNTVIVGAPTQRRNDAEAQGYPGQPGRANMQAVDTAAPPGNGGGVIGDVTRWTDKPGGYRPFSLEFNPLGLLIGGRLSFTAEWAPVVHNAIVFNGYYVNTSSDVAITGNTYATQTFTGGGGELGYRYYTGHRGMNGIFIGPSLILGAYNADLPRGGQTFTNAGLAVDAGVQTLIANHILVGAGAGVEYLNVSHDFHDLSTGPSTVASSGIKPRVLLSAGYGF